MTPGGADLAAVYGELLEREQFWATNKSRIWGLETGFWGLDDKIGGLHPGFIALGARTSHGKSALGMQIVLHAVELFYREWKTDGTVEPSRIALICSPEMDALALMERYATYQSNVPLDLIRTGQATEEQREDWKAAAQMLVEMQPCIHLYAGEDQSFPAITEVIDSLMMAAQRGGPTLGVVLIDYLQIISLGSFSQASDYSALTHMANALRSKATKYRIPILVASQLNRSIERDQLSGKMVERPPELSDFHGSGAIEAAADIALLLWRPPEDTGEEKPGLTGQEATLYIKKNRHGRVGEVKLEFHPSVVKFDDPYWIRQRNRRV